MTSYLSRCALRSVWVGALLVTAPPLIAQQQVVVLTGRVTDQATNGAVVGARVQITGTTIGAVTNPQGQFATGHRVGDLRRLVRQYGRAANTVYPIGAYHKDNLTRGSDHSFVIPTSEENNPNYSATGCDKHAP